MSKKRVELHLHTCMSEMDGLIPPEKAIAEAYARGLSGIAITDHGSIQAFPAVMKAAEELKGFQVIYGAEVLVFETDDLADVPHHAIILAKNAQGLRSLYQLVSDSYQHLRNALPCITKVELAAHRSHLLFGSACANGELFQAVLSGKSDAELDEIAAFYDYLEIHPTANHQYLIDEDRVKNEEELREINRRILQVGERLHKPVAATGDVHYLHPEDDLYRRMLLYHRGLASERNTRLHLRTTKEMLEEFAYLGEETAQTVVIDAPLAISRKIKRFRPLPSEYHPFHLDGAEQELAVICREKAGALYGEPLPFEVEERLQAELDCLRQNGLASPLILYKQIADYSSRRGYDAIAFGMIGSSLIAWLLGFTKTNPLPPHVRCSSCRYTYFIQQGAATGADFPAGVCPKCGAKMTGDGLNLSKEIFFGLHGEKRPVFSLKVSDRIQKDVLEFIQERLGKDRVFFGGTVHDITAYSARQMAEQYCRDHQIAPETVNMDAAESALTSIKREDGNSPAHLFIIPEGKSMMDFSPIQPVSDTSIMKTHFDWHHLEDTFFLICISPSSYITQLHLLEEYSHIPAAALPLAEPEVIALFSSCDPLGITSDDLAGIKIGTLGIPEAGSEWVRNLLTMVKPCSFDDLIRVEGLAHSRGGWNENRELLIKESTSTLSDLITTQDDLINGFLDKGIAKEQAYHLMREISRGRFDYLIEEDIALLTEHGVPDRYIESCRRIRYLWPRANTAHYAALAANFAWYKLHRPLAFYASYFTVHAGEADPELVKKLVAAIEHGKSAVLKEMERMERTTEATACLDFLRLINEYYQRGFAFLPAEQQKSHRTAFVPESGGIRLPLSFLHKNQLNNK